MNMIENMEDRHLDLMIELAFELEEAREVQRLLDEPVPQFTEAEKQSAQRALHSAFEKANILKRRKNLRILRNSTLYMIGNIAKIAACIALIIVIASPIALATSSEFRAKVMQLLIQIDNEEGVVRFSFIEDEEASFDVPEGWIGDYFLSYVPEGFSIYEFDPLFRGIEYRDTANRVLFFGEYDEYTTGLQGTDNSTVSYEYINGKEACIVEGYSEYGEWHIVSITWANDERWFQIKTYNIGRDETVRLAMNVKKIYK